MTAISLLLYKLHQTGITSKTLAMCTVAALLLNQCVYALMGWVVVLFAEQRLFGLSVYTAMLLEEVLACAPVCLLFGLGVGRLGLRWGLRPLALGAWTAGLACLCMWATTMWKLESAGVSMNPSPEQWVRLLLDGLRMPGLWYFTFVPLGAWLTQRSTPQSI